MAAIESLGIGSGLLTTELAENIINAEREPSEARLDSQKSLVETKISAFGELKAKIDEFGSAASALSTSNNILKTAASSSNDGAIDATTNSLAKPGTYIVEVDQVAQNHSLASKRFDDLTSTLGTGVLTFKFGETTFTDPAGDYDTFTQDIDQAEKTLVITSSNNTLSGIRDAINKDNFGVTASIVNDGEGFRLLLTSDQSGKDYSMEISASGSTSLKALSYNSAENDPNTHLTQTQAAQDAEFSLNGLDITSKNNEVNEVIKGVTFEIKQSNTGEPATIRVTQDTDALTENVQSFVESYNEFRTLYQDYSRFNPATETGGLLLSDSTLRSINAQMRRVITDTITGMEGSRYQSLAEVGIYSDQNNNYQLKFDSAVFSKAMKDSANEVAGVFSVQGSTSDSLIEYINPGFHSQAGTVSQIATQASITTTTNSALDFLSSLTVDANNDEFSINVDGNDADITLTHGSYATGDDLADMIQSAINNNDTLSKKSSSVTVSFDATNKRFDIISSKFGSDSEIAILSSDINTGSTLGIIAGSEGDAKGNYITNLSNYNFSASTVAAQQEVLATTAIDFSTDNATFTLQVNGVDGSVDGIDFPIIIDQDVGDEYDLNGEITTDRDRSDVLSAIQDKIDATTLNGFVTASFNSNNRLIFSTTEASGNQSIEIKAVGTNDSDALLGLSATDGVQTSGLSLTGGASFQLNYSNQAGSTTTSDISVPDGTYETSADLTTAIQTAINAHADVLASAAPAQTTSGATSLADSIDFTSDQAGFEFEYNGTSIDVDISANGADNLSSIQTALATALTNEGLVGDEVTASLDGNGLVLTTKDNGETQTLDVTQNGNGARTNVTGVTTLAAQDFDSSLTTFDLIVDGETISVDVTGDGSASIDSSLSVVQDALNDALEAVNGGDTFQAGDVLAKLDDSGYLYFETQSKLGSQSDETFGASSTISIANASANATTLLDLNNGAGQNGFDSLGLPEGLFKGFDATATVSYELNDNNEGRILVAFDEDTDVEFTQINTVAATQLGFAEPDGSENNSVKGLDVAGTINGIAATGDGQYLLASDGSVAATNGYIVSNTVAGFASPFTTDPANYNFKINVNGTESDTISLDSTTYSSGFALATDLQALINDDANLKAKGYKVTIDYDDDLKKFGIQSDLAGSSSKVTFSELTADITTMMGFTTANPGVSGKDQSGQTDDAAGIQIKVLGGVTGDRGSVSYVKGAADSLKSLINSFLKSDGIMTSKIDALENELVKIEEKRTELNARLDSSLDRLKRQFLYNDKIISSLKTTEDFLTQQFEALSAANSKK